MTSGVASSKDLAVLHFFERRVSLRARLLFGLVTLVIVGLVSGAFIIYSETRTSLLQQLDDQLNARVGPVAAAMSREGLLAGLTSASTNSGCRKGPSAKSSVRRAVRRSPFVSSTTAPTNLRRDCHRESRVSL